jgi:DNA repair protein RadC
MTTEKPKPMNSRRITKMVRAALFSQDADELIAAAMKVMEGRMRATNVMLTSPAAVRDYLRLALADKQEERFICIWLNAQHRVIEVQEAARGTLNQTSVHPREIVKSALACNAAAVIFAHNHPSGVVQPSQADELLTRNLKEALELVACKVLDHMIVAGMQTTSFAERGLL